MYIHVIYHTVLHADFMYFNVLCHRWRITYVQSIKNQYLQFRWYIYPMRVWLPDASVYVLSVWDLVSKFSSIGLDMMVHIILQRVYFIDNLSNIRYSDWICACKLEYKPSLKICRLSHTIKHTELYKKAEYFAWWVIHVYLEICVDASGYNFRCYISLTSKREKNTKCCQTERPRGADFKSIFAKTCVQGFGQYLSMI